MPEKIQYFTSYSGGDPQQPYEVEDHGLLSHGYYVRYKGDEATNLYRYRAIDKIRTYQRLNKEGIWVHSEKVERYVWLGSCDTLEEIDLEEAKQIAIMLGFPEVIQQP